MKKNINEDSERKFPKDLKSSEANILYSSILDYFIMSSDPKYATLHKIMKKIKKITDPSDRKQLMDYLGSETHTEDPEKYFAANESRKSKGYKNISEAFTLVGDIIYVFPNSKAGEMIIKAGGEVGRYVVSEFELIKDGARLLIISTKNEKAYEINSNDLKPNTGSNESKKLRDVFLSINEVMDIDPIIAERMAKKGIKKIRSSILEQTFIALKEGIETGEEFEHKGRKWKVMETQRDEQGTVTMKIKRCDVGVSEGRLYVGIKGSNREVFNSDETPTEATYGNKYNAVLGPFRTRKAADIAVRPEMHDNPHMQSVNDYEKYAASLSEDVHTTALEIVRDAKIKDLVASDLKRLGKELQRREKSLINDAEAEQEIYYVARELSVPINPVLALMFTEGTIKEEKMQAWTVWLNDKFVDIVFFSAYMNGEEVKRSLINHDGYDSQIFVIKKRGMQEARKVKGQLKEAQDVEEIYTKVMKVSELNDILKKLKKSVDIIDNDDEGDEKDKPIIKDYINDKFRVLSVNLDKVAIKVTDLQSPQDVFWVSKDELLKGIKIIKEARDLRDFTLQGIKRAAMLYNDDLPIRISDITKEVRKLIKPGEYTDVEVSNTVREVLKEKGWNIQKMESRKNKGKVI